jgi:hypothetical protein
MAGSHGFAVESYDCDGTLVQNCHPATHEEGMNSSNPPCNPATVDESSGDANISTCTGSENNCGNCADDGTVECNYTVTITDPETEEVIYTNDIEATVGTYSCS